MGSFTFTHETPLLIVKRTIPFSLAFTLTGQLPVGRVRIVHLRTHQGDIQKTMIGELAVSANSHYVVELSGKGGKHRAPQFAPVVLGKAGAGQYTIGYSGGLIHSLPPGTSTGGAFGTEIHPADGTEIEVVFGIEDGLELQPPIGTTLTGDFIQDGGHTVDPQVGPTPPVNPPAPPPQPPQPPAPQVGPANPPPSPPPSPAATDEQAARQKLILAAEEYAAHKAGLDPTTAALLELFLSRLVK